MQVDAEAFRRVMGHFATGVTVVTTIRAGRPEGITVNALTSVSLDPPLVVVALDRRRVITPIVRAVGRYAVNILGEDQQALSDCFAGAKVTPNREDFCGATWQPGVTGLPILEGSVATLECTITATHSAGDHDLFIARVDALSNPGLEAMPLLYYRRHYLRIERATALELEGRPEE